MSAQTFSLEEATTQICGTSDNDEPSPAQLQWVMRRLRRGEFSGYKCGRRWRMTQTDVDAAIEALRPKILIPAVPQFTGLTRTSARRLAG